MALALGASLPDVGTAASFVAAGLADAVLFSESVTSMGAESEQLVATVQPDRVIVVGGVAAVAPSVEADLRRLAPGVLIERLDDWFQGVGSAWVGVRVSKLGV